MILKDRRTRQLLTRTVSVTAALVVFVTTYALVLPAITMESEALCGVEAHQHDDSCYTEELVCGIPESDGHQHTEACYEVSRVLVCGKTDHQHGKSCYDADGKLICGIEEHTHDDVCYKEKRELVCGLKESEGHRHTEDCYRKVLTCGKEIHTHSTECYKDTAASKVMMEGAAIASDESSEITEMDFGEEESSELETFAATENEGAFEAGENGPAGGDASAFAEEDQFPGEGDRYSGEEDQFSEEENQILEEDGEITDSATEEDAYSAAADAADGEADEARENESSESPETDFSTDGEAGESGFAAEAEPAIDGEDGESGSGSANADHSIDGEEESESGTAEEGLSTEEDGEDVSGETDLAIGEAGEEDGSGEAADASGTGAADAETGDESVLREAGDQTGADSADTSAAAESETADSAETAAESEIASTAGTEDTSADPSAAAKEGYVPVLDQLHFARILNKKTAIYYSHAADQTDGSADNQTDGSADGAEAALFDTVAQDDQQADLSLSEGTAPDPAADWKKVNKDTELAPADLLRVYLAYTIPAGELNETNAVARYRLPFGLHLTDDQTRSINTTVNGIAAQYVDYDKLEILDVEAYNKYLGIEAVEGTRRPSDDIREYLEKNGQEEYISATVKAENVYNEISGELEGQDLIFTFAPYTVMKNRHEYNAEGKPVKAGEKVRGWVCLDLTTDQVDWETSQITTEEIKDEAAPEGTGQEEAQEPAEETADAETPEDGSATEAVEPAEETAGEESLDTDSAAVTEETEEETADAQNREDITAAETEAETSDTAAGKTVTIRQVEEKTAEIVFVEEDREFGIDEISSKLKMILVQDLVSEEAPASDSEEAAENAGTKDKETSDEKAAEDKAAGENTEDNRTGENAGNVNPADYPAATFDDRITVTAGSLNSDTETGSSPEKVTELKVHVEADEGTFPAGTAMRLAEADPDIVAAALEGSVEGRTKGFHAVDISFWSAPGDGSSTEPVEIEPLKPIRVSITSEAIRQAVEDSSTAPLVVHVEDSADESDKENKADKSDEADIAVKTQDLTETKDAETEGNADTLTFEADSFSVYAVVYTVDFHWEVNGKVFDFSIPGGGFVSLEHLVEVLGIGKSDTNTENGAEEAGLASGNKDGAEDADVEEKTDVSDKTDGAEEAEDVKASEEGSAEYDEAIRLNEAEVSEETSLFVADVEKVEFSDPELVWVGKAEEAATVGGLKEAGDLDIEYSADLTEEQIAEINAQTVETGDWALISMRPFTSEESLTVTMNNGDQFVVKVTDSQISTHVITADGKDFIITVTYGPEAKIPDGAELVAEELTKDSEEYEAYYNQAVEAIQPKIKNNEDTPDNIQAINEILGDNFELVKPSPAEIGFSRFFDISIMVDGAEIEPSAPVKVTIEYMNPVTIEAGEEPVVIHFAEDGLEVLETKTRDQNGDVLNAESEAEDTGEADETTGPTAVLKKEAVSQVTSFEFMQDSFSKSVTLVKDGSMESGQYVILRDVGYGNWAALKNNGTTEYVASFSNGHDTNDIDESFLWTFTRNENGNYTISNGNTYIRLANNNIIGTQPVQQKLDYATRNGYQRVGIYNPANNGQGLYFHHPDYWGDDAYFTPNSEYYERFYVAQYKVDDIDTSGTKVDDSVHYIVTDHYPDGNVTRANGNLTSGGSVSFAPNPLSSVYAGVTVTTGHDATTIGNNGNVTVSYNSNVHLVHVDYYYKEQLPSVQTIRFNNNDKYDTKDIDGERYYEISQERLHTDKTASAVEGGDGRSFNLTLEAWNVDWNIATVGMVLDASGSMAWDGAPGHTMQVNGDGKYEPYKFLSQAEVNKILYTDYSDYSPAGYGNYTYFVYEPGKSVNEYAPLGYYNGTARVNYGNYGPYLTVDGTINTAYATQRSVQDRRAGWYYVNTGNANPYNAIGGSKEYNGISTSSSVINRTMTIVKTDGTTKYIDFTNNNGYSDSIKQWFVENDTTGMYRKSSTYGSSQGTPAQFYVDGNGLLHCFYLHSDTIFESLVYKKTDDEPIKTEMLQDAIGSFTSTLHGVAPDSAIGMTRFSRSNYDGTDTPRSNSGFNDNQVTLLNWRTDSESIIGALNLGYGSGNLANGSTTDYGYENAGPLTVYNYGLTGNTSTQSGLHSFNTYLADNNAALTEWAKDNAKPIQGGYEYDKYVIVFTDGKDTDQTQFNEIYKYEAKNAADALKAKGYNVITVLLAPDSAFSNGNLNQEFTDAKNFLDTLNGARTDKTVTGLDWTNTTYIATAANKSALKEIFTDIAHKIAKTMKGMTVRDYIDPRFQMVDENDQPLAPGEYPELGFTLYYDEARDMQYVEWTNQDIPTNNVVDNTVVGEDGHATEISLWSQTIRVRAKDDFLGGNDILSNGNVEDLNKVYPDGSPGTTDPKKSRSFPRTTVDPELLKLELGETEDTLFLGERIDTAEHRKLESEIGDTVDSSWYYEYLDRYGVVTNQDYITQIQQGNTVTVPYYYFPDDTTRADFDAARLNPSSPHAYMKDQIGTLTYEWVPCDEDGNEITITDPYNHLTTNTDDVHYRLKIKYTPLTEVQHAANVNSMTDQDDYGRPVKPPAGTEQPEKESAKEDGIATIHVVSGQLTVSKRIKKEDILKYLTRHDEATFTFNLTKTGTPASVYPALGTDYTAGYDGYTYPTPLSVTVTAAAVNAAEEVDGYVTITGTTVEKLPVGTYEIVENTPSVSSFAFEAIGHLAVDANYRAHVADASTKVTFEIGRLAADASVTDPILDGKPELNAQRVSVFALNSVTLSVPVSIKKVDVGSTSTLLGNAVFSLYDSDAVDNSGKIKGDAVPIKTGITTDADDDLGFADLDELDVGTYYLVETSAPAGYVLPEYEYIKITVDTGEVTYQAGTAGEPRTAETITRNEQEVYLLEVYNSAGVELPAAGGPGTSLIYLLGIMLTAIAGAVLLMKRRPGRAG
ncbi:MAG: SpaA isopeptide-forming pilin-related protein [Eubacteriales bacterium]|nr:SpaA isopeptide-forming pilin-related protein [Eubacteriales bacterium]